MKAIQFSLLITSILMFVSCKKNQKDIEVKYVENNSKRLNVDVVNELDPICGMKTSEYLSDTTFYKGKIYGFCSEMCKETFLKKPEKYIYE